MAIFSIRNFVKKQMMKTNDQGIVNMPSDMKLDFGEAVITKTLLDAGIDPRIIKNDKQLETILDSIDKMMRDAAKPVDKGIKSTQSAKIFNLQGEELDPSKPIIGGTQQGKTINREFFERDAAAKELQQRIDSGVAATVEKMLAMKPIDAMKEANRVIKREGPYKNLTQQDAKKILQDTEDHIFERNIKPKETDMDFDDNDFAEGGRIGFFKGAVAGGGNISPGTDVKGNVRDDNPFTGGGGGGPKKPPSPPTKDTKQKTPVVINPIKNLQTHFANNQKLKDAVALGLITNDEYNILGGYDAKQTLGMGPVDTGLSSLAYNVVQSFKGDQPFSDIFGDVARNVKGASSISPELQAKYENIMQMADGGRIGFKKGMTRRKFLEIMGGIGAAGAAAKTGLLKLMGKEKTAPVGAKVMENFSSTLSEPPPYFFELVKKIKLNGKKSKVGPSDRVDEYSYTGKNGDEYTLTEDITTGDAQITKDKIGGRSYEEGSYDVIEDRTVMEYKAPKQDVDVETQKTTNEAAEYEEYRVDFDQDGTEAGAEAVDEYIQKEIIEEAGEEATSIKKAEGGRIPFIFGGGIFKAVIKNLAKEKGISPSEYLNITNYRLLPDSAKRIMSKSEYLKLKEEMTGKRIEMVENVRDMIESRLAFDKSKADLAASMNKASPGYGDAAVKMMFPEGSFKSPVPAGAGEKDVMMMEQLIKNLQTKGRKENASGGLAGMLGE
jgi:hypothetical protein